jgi:hypothetical protein
MWRKPEGYAADRLATGRERHEGTVPSLDEAMKNLEHYLAEAEAAVMAHRDLPQ